PAACASSASRTRQPPCTAGGQRRRQRQDAVRVGPMAHQCHPLATRSGSTAQTTAAAPPGRGGQAMIQLSPFQDLLFSAYTEEADRYQRALEVARQLPADFQQGGTGENQLQQIAALLDEVKLIEARIAETKQAWEASGQKPGPQLKSVLTRVTE